MATDVLTAATGRWPEILRTLAGLAPEQLSNRHQSCPLCGGRDRYRFDDRDGSGSWFCNQCGGKDRMGGGGSGIDLLMRSRNWTFRQACRELERYLDLPPPAAGRHRPQLPPSPNGSARPAASSTAASALPGHPRRMPRVLAACRAYAIKTDVKQF